MDTPCWPWTASKRGGYGAFSLHGKIYLAHRIAFLIGGGVFTESKPQANHRCGNKVCCNPHHLYAGDQQENVRDMDNHGTRVTSRGDNNGARIHPEKLTRGERLWNCKLTDAQCAYIRTSPLSQTAIARELGVSQSHISRIRSSKLRNLLTPEPTTK